MSAASCGASADAAPARAVVPTVTTRDPRLDLYRGLAMFIILIAHTPKNYFTLWIPARFGFSDATEIFVFCSGMASAIAFGRVFDRRGWLMGTARVTYRVWQVYWAHICVFFLIAMILAAIDNTGLYDKSYVGSLNLGKFFADPKSNIVGLFTLTYVPNYFDILPMYLVILAMMPAVMAISRVSVYLAVVAVWIVWLAANMGVLALPAEPWSDRKWYFNPFGWQLVFFTGFAFMRGWIKPPPLDRRLVIAAVLVVLVSVPFAYFRILREVPELREISQDIKIFRNKSNFGILRYIHFMALAYLGWAAAGEGGRGLMATGSGLASRFWRRFVAIVQKVGQQSLAVFVFSMVAARLIGFVLDQVGRRDFHVELANLAGFASLVAVAYSVAWFKSHPWRKLQ